MFRYVILLCCLAISSQQAKAEDLRAFTLTQAVDEALANSPRVASSAAGIQAALGGLRQAGAMPNPALGIQGQNLGGSGVFKDVDNSAQLTYGLSQQIEMGGKRTARQNAAQQQLELAKLDDAVMRYNVTREVKVAFANAVAAQETVRLTEDALTIAQQELKSVSHRVAEAASPLIQKSKAEVSVATARFNVEQAKQELVTARSQLATQLGRSVLTERLDTSAFYSVAEPKAAQKEALDNSPDMLRLRIEEARVDALLDIEKAAAIPDPTVNLGVQQITENNDRAFMLGLSIPIPVLNSNQGNIAQARAEVSRTTSEQQAQRLALHQRFNEVKAALHTAYTKAVSYKATVMPAAEDAFALARQGYGAGKFQYLEVLDAQRTLFDSRAQYVSALRDYHTRQADLERLTTSYAPAERKGETDAKE